MRPSIHCIFLATVLTAASCSHKKENDSVVSQRYIHKYGYAVSKAEFEQEKYPGQVITLSRDGVTTTVSYAEGVLHGPSSVSFPNSQILQSLKVYDQGILSKETTFTSSGLPIKEEIRLSPTRQKITSWYAEGTPIAIEEFSGKELLEGEYFLPNHEPISSVIKGKGKRVIRDALGKLLYQDQIDEGYTVKRETFYPNGSPESVSFFKKEALHGEVRTFATTGEPISTAEYVDGVLHGKTTLYKNGAKDLEVYYLNGLKNGKEIHYLDGETVSLELSWDNDQKHGPAKYLVDGVVHTEYYYEGSRVPESRWQELAALDAKLGQQ